MGGNHYACASCGGQHFAFHSCNHKACPRCGTAATFAWVQRSLEKRINAPYFLVTFTLPEELRSCFFGPFAKEFYDLFFAAVSGAMTEKLASAKGFKATVNGFIAVLHTWGQLMQFHPHIHLLVPGAGLNVHGKVVRVKKDDYLIHDKLLKGAFRQHFRTLLAETKWQVDPAVWSKTWGVHIQAVGSGEVAVKYLGNYVARSVISDSRIVAANVNSVTFRWKDRADNRFKDTTVPGTEFVKRYLRHVIPRGLRSIRYYGHQHPAAVRSRDRIKMHTGSIVYFGARPSQIKTKPAVPKCQRCKIEMQFAGRLPKAWSSRNSPGSRGPPQNMPTVERRLDT